MDNSLRSNLLESMRKTLRMHKQSIPGLTSPRGWPGVKAGGGGGGGGVVHAKVAVHPPP